MRSRVTSTLWISLLLAVACSKEEPPPTKRDPEPIDWQPPVVETIPSGVTYTDMTRRAGIDFVHYNAASANKWLPETMGAGVAVIEFEPGDVRLLFIQGQLWEGQDRPPEGEPTMRLYKRIGEWQFKDVTKESGLDVPCHGMGCAVADYDDDGDPDLYVTCLGPNLLFRNDGGKFVRVEGAPDGGKWTDEEGNEIWSWSTGAAWFDANGDGRLDLIVLNYVHWTPETDVKTKFTDASNTYTRPQLYDGDTVRLYLQKEDGSFEDATARAGLRIVQRTGGKVEVAGELGPIEGARDMGKSLGLVVDDFNRDGILDFMVANDTVQNFMFCGRKDGSFNECAQLAGVAFDDKGLARAGMGIDSAEVANDGRSVVAIGNFSGEPVFLFKVLRELEDHVVMEDEAVSARIGEATLLPLTFGLAFLDADLDGWPDLVLANGHIEPTVANVQKELQYEQAPQLFRNREGKRFFDVSLDAGAPFRKRIVGRGLAYADLDDDGDLDLIITSNGGRPMVLRADLQEEHRSLRLRLRQPERNRDAIGAVALVTANGVTQRRMVRTGGSYLSQSELTLTFGLGKAGKADKVTVVWPDGTRQELGPLAAGSHVIVRK